MPQSLAEQITGLQARYMLRVKKAVPSALKKEPRLLGTLAESGMKNPHLLECYSDYSTVLMVFGSKTGGPKSLSVRLRFGYESGWEMDTWGSVKTPRRGVYLGPSPQDVAMGTLIQAVLAFEDGMKKSKKNPRKRRPASKKAATKKKKAATKKKKAATKKKRSNVKRTKSKS